MKEIIEAGALGGIRELRCLSKGDANSCKLGFMGCGLAGSCNLIGHPEDRTFTRAALLSALRKWLETGPSEGMIEAACRAYCIANGDDPDSASEPGPPGKYPLWENYAPEFRPALSAFLAQAIAELEASQ